MNESSYAENVLAANWSSLDSIASLNHHFAIWFEDAATRSDDSLAHLTRIAMSARKTAEAAIIFRTQNNPNT